MIPRYPRPTSGSGPSVPGRSTTWITASAASASAPTARATTSAACAGGAWLRSNIVLLQSSGPRGSEATVTPAVVPLSTTNTDRRGGGFSTVGPAWCDVCHTVLSARYLAAGGLPGEPGRAVQFTGQPPGGLWAYGLRYATASGLHHAATAAGEGLPAPPG